MADAYINSQAAAPVLDGRCDSAFVYPEYKPVFEAIDGIRFDFNHGFRISFPDNGFRHRCKILDLDSGSVVFDSVPAPGAVALSRKKFYVRYRVLLIAEDGKELWRHDLDMSDKDVLVEIPVKGALGDSIAWFSMMERFMRQNRCRLHLLMPPHLAGIFRNQYKAISFETVESARKLRPYATYYMGLFFKGDENWQPYDFRLLSLSEQAGRILGVHDLSEIPPRLSFGPRPESRPRPYVVVATHGSAHAKHWCNPQGWRELIEYLTRVMGYDVVCIDKTKEVGVGDVWHYMPNGCIDDTGNKPLQERIDMIHHADFFIGLSSGLSWIAWCCKVPVVLISGICMPFGEFQTPYRIQPRGACHGCWNDTRYEFDHNDFMWCPRFKGTDRAYECTKAISAGAVVNMIKRIPSISPPSLFADGKHMAEQQQRGTDKQQ